MLNQVTLKGFATAKQLVAIETICTKRKIKVNRFDLLGKHITKQEASDLIQFFNDRTGNSEKPECYEKYIGEYHQIKVLTDEEYYDFCREINKNKIDDGKTPLERAGWKFVNRYEGEYDTFYVLEKL